MLDNTQNWVPPLIGDVPLHSYIALKNTQIWHSDTHAHLPLTSVGNLCAYTSTGVNVQVVDPITRGQVSKLVSCKLLYEIRFSLHLPRPRLTLVWEDLGAAPARAGHSEALFPSQRRPHAHHYQSIHTGVYLLPWVMGHLAGALLPLF